MRYLIVFSSIGLFTFATVVHPNRIAAQVCNTDADCVNSSCSPNGQCAPSSEAGSALGDPATAEARLPGPPPNSEVALSELSDVPPPPPEPNTPMPAPAGSYPNYGTVPQPVDYETVSRPRKSLSIAGAVTFGIPWILTASASYSLAQSSDDSDYYRGMIPVAGPLFLWSELNDDTPTVVAAALVFLSLAQAAGITMFTLGFVLTHEEQVPVYQTTIVPTLIGDDGGGLVAIGTF